MKRSELISTQMEQLWSKIENAKSLNNFDLYLQLTEEYLVLMKMHNKIVIAEGEKVILKACKALKHFEYKNCLSVVR